MSSRILTSAAIAGLGLASTLANADDWRHDARRYRGGPDVDTARVVDVTPLVERVRYREPVEECFDVERVERRPDRTGATIAGGLLGAVIGHQFGSGSGRRAATVAGAVIGGAVAGNSARAEARDEYDDYDRRDRVSYETQCRVRDEARYEERIRAYRVTYRYHGREYITEMPYDPGPRLRVAVDARPL